MKARQAFQTLKGMIQLQALIRRHLVRRQAVSSLYCVKGIVKFQALARGYKVRHSDIGLAVQKICKVMIPGLYAMVCGLFPLNFECLLEASLYMVFCIIHLVQLFDEKINVFNYLSSITPLMALQHIYGQNIKCSNAVGVLASTQEQKASKSVYVQKVRTACVMLCMQSNLVLPLIYYGAKL